jgi:hypothetical protein
VPDSGGECNYAEGLILERLMVSDEFRLLDDAVGAGSTDERLRLNTELINLVSQTAEQSVWLGMALAYRFFVGGAR